MIAFGSQRGNGSDLATHLSNAEDNEFVEIKTYGFLADDVHGALSEAEAQAYAMTKLEKYLYSLSINPDPNQPWTDEMYADYINRSGVTLGLQDQPYVTAKHIKQGGDGLLREHMHIVWSRVDVQNSRGINISHDRLKLMELAREFAHDHGLRLPEGYYDKMKNHEQASLYEMIKESETGITREHHKVLVTDIWRTSDSPKAFVAALEDMGYMLATGRRPYVLVDTYGKIHALPRLIDDKEVRTKDVEAYLQDEFPPESLSTVEEAQAVAARHQESRKRIELSQKLIEQKEILKRDQDMRYEALQAEILSKQEQQKNEATRLSDQHGDSLYVHKLNASQMDMEINFKRAVNAPTGLAGFLSRITGMDIVRKQFHAHQDRKREAATEQTRIEIEERNREERLNQEHKHKLEMIEIRRRESEQRKSFEREERSIAMAQEREKVAHYSKRYQHMPSVQLELTPRGRRAVPAKAMRRHYSPTVKDPNVKASTQQEQQETQSTSNAQTDGEYIGFADTWEKSSGDTGEFYDPEKDDGKGRRR